MILKDVSVDAGALFVLCRKKVVDFYQRSCMAGQCVAVSFKPLLQPYDPEIDATCVELPASLNSEESGTCLQV